MMTVPSKKLASTDCVKILATVVSELSASWKATGQSAAVLKAPSATHKLNVSHQMVYLRIFLVIIKLL